MEKLRLTSLFLMTLVIFGSFAPFVTAQFTNPASAGFAGENYGSITNTYQSSSPTFDNFYGSSSSTYWPILNNLKEDQCDSTNSDFIIGIPVGGCSPMVVRSDLLAEQNVPVFCQLSAIRVNPLIDVSTIKSISFKGDYPDEVAGISFHPARAAVKSYSTLLGDPIEENIGYVVIVLKQQPDERDLEEYVSGMLTATIQYDAQGAFGTGAAEYYLEPVTDDEWNMKASENSFWAGKGYLRVKNVDQNEATIDVMTSKENVYRTVTLAEGETSDSIYYPGQYCTASMTLKLNKIDNSEDMAKVTIDGDNFWVRKGSKILDGKCVVRDLNVFPSGSGSIEFSCSGNSRFTLVLGDSGVVLNNGSNIVTGIGGIVVGSDKKNYYLGYYGKSTAMKTDSNSEGEFSVLTNVALSEDDVSALTGFVDNEDFNNQEEFVKALDNQNIFSKEGGYSILLLNGDSGLGGISLVPVGEESKDGEYSETTFIPKYLNLSEQAVLDLTESFPSDKKDNDEYWGEEALYKQIILAGKASDYSMQVDLIKKFLATYPDSYSVEYMRDLKLDLENFDHAGASANILVNNEDYNIRVEGFASGSGASDSVTVRFAGGTLHTLKRSGVYDVTDNFEQIIDVGEQARTVPRLVVTDIDGTSASLNYIWRDTERNVETTSSATIDVGEYSDLGGVRVQVTDTKVREVAYVSLIPEIKNTKTEANFTFNIGIEKRAIELSPEKAQKKVDALDKSIADWESKIESLGKLVKGLKAACLATSTVLTLKSFVSGFAGGAAIAREKVMDVYEAKCRKEGYTTPQKLQECYSLYGADIEKDVSAYGDAIVGVNEKVSGCTEGSEGVKSGFLETKVVDSKKYISDLRKCGVADGWQTTIGDTILTRADLSDASDFQAVMLMEEACKIPESVACAMAKEEVNAALADNIDRKKDLEKTKQAENDLGVPLVFTGNNAKSIKVIAEVVTKDFGGIKKGENVAGVEYNGEKYYVIVDKKTSYATSVYTEKGSEISAIPSDKQETAIVTINKDYDFVVPSEKGSSCSNPMNEAYVRYYEEANKQGFAAIVPISKKDGWYVYVASSNYDSSGVATSFEICNVGRDGKMGEGSKDGDLCQYVQASSASSLNSLFTPCPSMASSGAAMKLYQKAEAAIREANRNGNGISLDGEFVHKSAPLGASSTGLECTDFMSVSDCNLMFNVCDPVICPTSRCDLGGKFPVSDVIASGIIGSIALCLPNFGSPAKGGVAIPVCLSGIHAGLDSYVSILRSHKECLEQNIETGEYIGICDEITAIYTCEFFWGQISPLMESLLTKFVDSLYSGGQTKGGAEYLTTAKAFENLDNSIDYFSNNYMESSLRAFNLKNTEEVGGTICKGFIGSSVPTSADMIDSLLEPESPSQFYAYFSEDVFSDVTVPSTSHYKVYYHIYAGNDEGAQYRVYLKSPPESSYYASRQTVLVESGYAAKGIAADESIDFTAPTGYKELCVSINGVDECGFGSVTSDFGLNYASQQYVADQADDRQITSTEDCVTTSTSAWALAQPNLQSGVEDAFGQDDIATSGIVRVCASVNPDQGVIGGNDVYCVPSEGITDNSRCGSGYSCVEVTGETGSNIGVCKNNNNNQVSQGQWVDVGYCDNQNMRCWLDSSSVGDNLGQYMAVNNLTVSELVRDSEDLIELNEQYATVKEKISGLNKKIDGLKDKDADGLLNANGVLVTEAQDIINGLDEIIGVGENIGQGSNAAKAEALSIKASVYRFVVEKLIVKYPYVETSGMRPEGDEETGGEDVEAYENVGGEDGVTFEEDLARYNGFISDKTYNDNSFFGMGLNFGKRILNEDPSADGDTALYIRKNIFYNSEENQFAFNTGFLSVFDVKDRESLLSHLDTLWIWASPSGNGVDDIVEEKKDDIYSVIDEDSREVFFRCLDDEWEFSLDKKDWVLATERDNILDSDFSRDMKQSILTLGVLDCTSSIERVFEDVEIISEDTSYSLSGKDTGQEIIKTLGEGVFVHRFDSNENIPVAPMYLQEYPGQLLFFVRQNLVGEEDWNRGFYKYIPWLDMYGTWSKRSNEAGYWDYSNREMVYEGSTGNFLEDSIVIRIWSDDLEFGSSLVNGGSSSGGVTGNFYLFEEATFR